MERNSRKVFIGKVVSDKEDKTIKVAITTYRRHPLYGKRVELTTKLTAHDENNEAHIGDTVQIVQTRPLSKDKCWRVVQILERAK